MKSTSVEGQVRELFIRQAAGVQPGDVEWGDVSVVSPASQGRHGPVGLLLVAAATIVLLGAIGWIVSRPGTDGGQASDDGPSDPAIDVSSDWVRLTAASLVVDVGGQQFSPAGLHVDISSDPGSPTYTTLELIWRQHGVEMWINLYFARDVDTETWSVTEIRVRDGFASDVADWVTSTPGTFALGAPMDTEYHGDLTVQLTDGRRPATLTIVSMTLRPFMTFLVHATDNSQDTVPRVAPSTAPSVTEARSSETIPADMATTSSAG